MPLFFTLINFLTIDFGRINTAGPGPHDNRRSLRGYQPLFQSGIPKGLRSRNQPQLIASGKAPALPPVEVIGPPESLNLGGDLNPKSGGVKKIHRSDTGLSQSQVFPKLRPVSPQGIDRSHPGYHHPPGFHYRPHPLARKGSKKIPFPRGVCRGQKMLRRTMRLIS